MPRFRSAFAAAALAVTTLGGFALPTAAAAAVDQSSPGRFIGTLTDEAFGAIRSAGSNHAAARAKFRALLAQNFAVDEIGDRLIARWRPTITPAQYEAYKAALPSFVIGAYADRLFDYADSTVTVGATRSAGSNTAVLTRVTRPGLQPVNAIWTVEGGSGGYKVTNLTVAGINLVLTQQADFNSFVQRKGFDALVAFMKSRS